MLIEQIIQNFRKKFNFFNENDDSDEESSHFFITIQTMVRYVSYKAVILQLRKFTYILLTQSNKYLTKQKTL